MPKSLSKGIRLRGVFTKVTPSKHKKEKVFPKKLPITKDFRTKHQLKENEFQYYYTTSEDLMVGYKGFIKMYCQKTEKTTDQYALDITDIWLEIHTDMTLYPNELKDEENLESNFFCPKSNS